MSDLTTFEIMTDKRLNEVEISLVDIKGKLEKIFNAVVGNSELDQLGLIGRIKKLEEDALDNKAFKNKLIGMAAIGGGVTALVMQLLKYLVTK
jgi:hypothetical protein